MADKKKGEKSGHKVVATNRKAGFNYSLEDRLEAGIVLMGSEIKSIRAGRANLSDGYVLEKGGEMWLMNVHISEYEQANRFGHEPTRPRKLLLHKKEIARMISQMNERGYTVVPTQMYLKNGKAKVEIALAKGKKQYDKRAAVSERDTKREIDRALKERYSE
jgi:SsrA-binding protein